MQMTAHKAVAAFLTSLFALVAMFGVSTEWASPSLIEGVSVVLGSVLTAAVTYLVPNKTKA
jgi:hypothetical protein